MRKERKPQQAVRIFAIIHASEPYNTNGVCVTVGSLCQAMEVAKRLSVDVTDADEAVAVVDRSGIWAIYQGGEDIIDKHTMELDRVLASVAVQMFDDII